MGDDRTMTGGPRTFHHSAFVLGRLLAAKGGRSVSVCIPARDEQATVAAVVSAVRRPHVARAGGSGLVDEVVVVDDGSADPAAVAAICARHAAALVRRDRPGGPAAARNAALAGIATDLVAFVDSDCHVPSGWVGRLLGHFADPLVVGAAPRVVTSRPRGPRSALDMGDRSGTVGPGGRVPYVPTAALVLRREPLGTGFDPSLRHGEDVDLVWRLRGAGWRLRYDPSVEVVHDDPTSLGARLRRRFDYGTSVGPLARRHPGELDHLVVAPAPALAVGALVGGWPAAAAVCAGVTVRSVARPLRRRGVGWPQVGRLAARTMAYSWLGIGRWCGQFAWPVLPAVIAAPGGGTRGRRTARRLMIGLLVVTPLVEEQRQAGEPASRWLRGLANGLLEQAAYGAGAFTGCRRERLAAPIVPHFQARRRRAGRSRR